jgi:putative ABC transport system permease protein
MAYRSLIRRKTRTILTISGIVVGVTMILVLLSLAAGTSTSTNSLLRGVVSAQITVVNSTTPSFGGFTGGGGGFGGGGFGGGGFGGGGGTFFTRTFAGGGGGGFEALFGAANTIPESYANTVTGLGGVYAISPQLSTTGYVDNNTVLIDGINPSAFTQVTSGITISNGTMLGSADQIVLNSILASNLGVGVGANVTVSYGVLNATTTGSTYSVSGIYSAGSTFGPASRTVYMELSSAQSLSNKTGLLSEIDVKTTSPSAVHSVASEIDNALAGVTANTSSGVASEQSLSASLATFFIAIGLVALLAGAFGVINTMVMSISERTREIGTLRAIGAQKSQVIRLFLSESLLIGLIGAIGGVFIGIIISAILPYFSSSVANNFGGLGLLQGRLATTVTASNIVLCMGLGIAVGVLAGIYPALRASRMNPVEALRHV